MPEAASSNAASGALYVLVDQPVGQCAGLPLTEGGQHRVGLDPGVAVVDGDGQSMADQQQFHRRAGP